MLKVLESITYFLEYKINGVWTEDYMELPSKKTVGHRKKELKDKFKKDKMQIEEIRVIKRITTIETLQEKVK